MKKLFLASFITAFCAGVSANTYQHQSDLDFGWGDVTNGDIHQWSAAHQFYLTPVNLRNNVPYAESAFIGRNSSLGAAYNYVKLKPDNGSDFSHSSWMIGGEYMDRGHDFYGALQWAHANNIGDDIVFASAGYFVSKDWLVKLDVRHTRPDSAGSLTEYGISTKKLLMLDTGDAVNIEASYMDRKGSSLSEYGVAADYYFGQNMALGVGYDWTSTGVFSTDSDFWTLRGHWFVTPALALKAEVAFDGNGDNNDAYRIGASYRF